MLITVNDGSMFMRNLILKSKQIEEMKGLLRIHFLNSNAERIRKSVGDKVGLSKIGVHIIHIEPGKDDTEILTGPWYMHSSR